MIEWGDTEVVSVPSNGYKDIIITHRKSHVKVPNCTATLSSGSSAPGLSANVSFTTQARTTSNTTIRLMNSNTADLNLRLSYLLVSTK